MNDDFDENIDELEGETEENITEEVNEPLVNKSRNNFNNEYHNREYYKNEADKRKQRQLNAYQRRNNNSKEVVENGENVTKGKNALDKLGDNLNVAKTNLGNANGALNDFQNKANIIAHPVDSLKGAASAAVDKKKVEIKSKVAKKALAFIAKNPWIIFILVVLIALLLILVFLVGETDLQKSETDDNPLDFTTTTVDLIGHNGFFDNIHLDYLNLEEYASGAAYYYLYLANDDFQNLTSEQRYEAYKAFMVYIKAYGFALAGYSSDTKEITIKSTKTDGVIVCEPVFGCVDVTVNVLGVSVHSYVSKELAYRLLDVDGNGENAEMKGKITKEFDAASSGELALIDAAYEETKEELLVPTSSKKGMKSASTAWFGDSTTGGLVIGNQYLPETINSRVISLAQSGYSYEDIIALLFPETASSDTENTYVLYNYTDATNYFSYGYKGYWYWPIGSKEATDDAGIIYDGDPASVRITSNFGLRESPTEGGSTNHLGIDIAADAGTPVISPEAGKVLEVFKTDSCGNGVRIDHGNGLVSRYCHMQDNSIVVTKDEEVKKGQIIGRVGSTGVSTGPHLHFEVYVNDEITDPLDYVDPDNPRPVNTTVIGSGDEQSVCLTLKDRGFSDEAVAAIMGNMVAESGFNPVAIGDSGTSYGLCQWHAGRWTNLRNFCNGMEATIGCQIDYLINEIQNGYEPVYANLMDSSMSVADKAKSWAHTFEVCSACGYDGGDSELYVRASNAEGYYSYVKNGCE